MFMCQLTIITVSLEEIMTQIHSDYLKWH